MAELIARITALLRRPGGALGMTLEASNVRLDTVGRELTIGGTPSAVPKNTSRSLGSMPGKTRRCRNRGFELHQHGRLHLCIKPAVNFETPDQIPGFSV